MQTYSIFFTKGNTISERDNTKYGNAYDMPKASVLESKLERHEIKLYLNNSIPCLTALRIYVLLILSR